MTIWFTATLLTASLIAGTGNCWTGSIGGMVGGNFPGTAMDIYQNTSSMTFHGHYLIESLYALGLRYSHSTLEVDPDIITSQEDQDLDLLFLEIKRFQQAGERLSMFASMGLGQIMTDDNDEFGFSFGLGFHYPLAQRLALDVTLVDHMTELAIPFVSFPSFNVVASGSGDHYLQVSIGFSIGLGKQVDRSASGRSCRW